MQKRIAELLGGAPEIRVVGNARDGVEALRLAQELDPDVITMDIGLPKMDGLEATREIMASNPKPIVIFSSYARRDESAALGLGVVDVLEKPSGSVSLDVENVARELIEKVRVAARVRVVRNAGMGSRASRVASEPSAGVKFEGRDFGVATPDATLSDGKTQVSARALGTSDDQENDHTAGGERAICIGSSTGGPGILTRVLASLPEDYPLPIVIAQHMPQRFTSAFASQLNDKVPLQVKEAVHGETLRGGSVYLIPGGSHARLSAAERVEILKQSDWPGPSPSADVLFESAATLYGKDLVAIVLSGMGSDGAAGLEKVHRLGGLTVAQSERSCVVYGMPRAAIERGCVRRILAVEEIIMELRRHAIHRSRQGRTP